MDRTMTSWEYDKYKSAILAANDSKDKEALRASEETKGAEYAAKLLFNALLQEISDCKFLDLYNKKEDIPFNKAKDMVEKASSKNELTLILLPPLLSNNFTLPFISSADGVVFIEKLHFCKKSNIERLLDAVDTIGTKKLGFILI